MAMKKEATPFNAKADGTVTVDLWSEDEDACHAFKEEAEEFGGMDVEIEYDDLMEEYEVQVTLHHDLLSDMLFLMNECNLRLDAGRVLHELSVLAAMYESVKTLNKKDQAMNTAIEVHFESSKEALDFCREAGLTALEEERLFGSVLTLPPSSRDLIPALEGLKDYKLGYELRRVSFEVLTPEQLIQRVESLAAPNQPVVGIMG